MIRKHYIDFYKCVRHFQIAVENITLLIRYTASVVSQDWKDKSAADTYLKYFKMILVRVAKAESCWTFWTYVFLESLHWKLASHSNLRKCFNSCAFCFYLMIQKKNRRRMTLHHEILKIESGMKVKSVGGFENKMTQRNRLFNVWSDFS